MHRETEVFAHCLSEEDMGGRNQCEKRWCRFNSIGWVFQREVLRLSTIVELQTAGLRVFPLVTQTTPRTVISEMFNCNASACAPTPMRCG